MVTVSSVGSQLMWLVGDYGGMVSFISSVAHALLPKSVTFRVEQAVFLQVESKKSQAGRESCVCVVIA